MKVSRRNDVHGERFSALQRAEIAEIGAALVGAGDA